MSGLHHKGRSLHMDNFHQLRLTVTEIVKKETCVEETRRSYCKHNPDGVIVQKLNTGEPMCGYTEGNVCVVKWKCKRDVSTVCSELTH